MFLTGSRGGHVMEDGKRRIEKRLKISKYTCGTGLAYHLSLLTRIADITDDASSL